VVLGALTVGAYDRVLADIATDGLRRLGSLVGAGVLSAADLHGWNYALFGVALYAAILVRSRPARGQRTADLLPTSAPESAHAAAR
jgi:hypothetical protein